MENNNESQKKRKSSKSRIIIRIIIALLIVVVAVCAYKIYDTLAEYNVGDSAYESLIEAAGPHVTTPDPQHTPASSAEPTPFQQTMMDFDELYAINPDTVAWLMSDGTVINYPVVQGEDNIYYLHHIFNGKANNLGTLFIDCNNAKDFSDRNTIIIGHHMRNGSMMASIVGYKKQDYYDAHKTVTLITPDMVYDIYLFGGYVTSAGSDDYLKRDFTDEEFTAFINKIKERSTFQSDVEVAPEDHIVTLATCSYEYDHAMYAVFGTLVPRG